MARFEQRICDLCGSRSEIVLVKECDPNPFSPPQSMSQRGWDTVGGKDGTKYDRCADCAWMEYVEPHQHHEPIVIRGRRRTSS